MDEKDAGSQPIPNAYRALVQFVVTVPTVQDRFIQQLLLQVLTPIFDPSFSEHSYGFRFPVYRLELAPQACWMG